MKSPKFRFSLQAIHHCVNKSTLQKAWRKKLGAQLRRQILADLVEFKDFSLEISSHCQEIAEEIATASYSPSRPVHFLVEKSRGLCRQMTISHPRDMLILQSLSSALYSDIKKSTPTNKSYFEPGIQPFNERRLLHEAGEYGTIASWKRFQEAIFEFSKERNFVVVTDIANFYDFINFSHMRNVIADLCNVKEPVLDFLIYILNEISWNPDFMPRNEIGLPQMELEAPRVLANAMLFELDKVADEHALGDYVRFMDDIDVGVDTIVQAKKVVRDIDLTLQSRQLRLNSSKTKILSTKTGEAARHFCARENFVLDRCAHALDQARTPKVIRPQARRLSVYYRLWRGAPLSEPMSERARFFEGNGEKIFKRITTLLNAANQKVPESDLIWLIKNRPSLRSHCFFHLMNSRSANNALYEVEKILNSGAFIDDAAIVDMAKFMVHARFTQSNKLHETVKRICNTFKTQFGYVGYYCCLLVHSRFAVPQEIADCVQQGMRFWKSDFWLGRTVGGMLPVVSLDAPSHKLYLRSVQDSDNRDARAVCDFHYRIENDIRMVEKLYDYAKSPNPTYPQKIYHPKSLIILSIFKNTNSQPQKDAIIQRHNVLKRDPYYQNWGVF